MIAGFDRPACRLSVRAAIAILTFHVSYIISYFFRLVKRNLTNHLQIRQLFRHFTQFFLKTVPLLFAGLRDFCRKSYKTLTMQKGVCICCTPLYDAPFYTVLPSLFSGQYRTKIVRYCLRIRRNLPCCPALAPAPASAAKSVQLRCRSVSRKPVAGS